MLSRISPFVCVLGLVVVGCADAGSAPEDESPASQVTQSQTAGEGEDDMETGDPTGHPDVTASLDDCDAEDGECDEVIAQYDLALEPAVRQAIIDALQKKLRFVPHRPFPKLPSGAGIPASSF